MDKRSAGVARYNDDSGEHRGFYLSNGWLKFLGIAGPAGAILVGAVLWFAARPDRTEMDQKIQAVRVEMKAEILQSRNEIRQDIQDLRTELRRLLRGKEK